MDTLRLGRGTAEISKDMYGLFFEDINYSLDGGLNGEMLENRNFEARFSTGKRDDYTVLFDGGYGWYVSREQESEGFICIDSREPLNEVNPHYLAAQGQHGGVMFENKAYDGICAAAGTSLTFRFYAKTTGEKPVTVQIKIRKNGKTYDEGIVRVSGDGWTLYEGTLKLEESVKKAQFVVAVKEDAWVAFDQFSLKPDNLVLGLFRPDLVEKLKALNPSFMRFPGGCIVEGNTLENRYQWKKTLGPVEERKYNWSRWAVHNGNPDNEFTGPFAHYGQTYDIGYYEFFLLCEYLGAKPLPVMNVGLACQFMSSEKVDMESVKMQEYIQDALDLIEFANGDKDSEWGSVRVTMGHEEPFGLTMLGIGNEQWQTDDINFYGRYEMFQQAIHEKYPKMKLIGTSGPDVWGGGYYRAWDWAKKKIKDNPDFMYAMDEHYYVAPEWLYDHVHFYDGYQRDIKVFAGEYACHVPGHGGRLNHSEANTLEAAIAEAAFLTGVERNADVVTLASYAPLLARIGYSQWSPDLIWFDGASSYCTPSYYVQQLFSVYRGTKTVNADFGWNEEQEKQEKLYAGAVTDKDGRLIVKLVNASDQMRTVKLASEERKDSPEEIKLSQKEINTSSEGGKLDSKEIKLSYQEIKLSSNASFERKTLSGNPQDCNCIGEEERIRPQSSTGTLQDGAVTLEPHSFSVFIFGA